ncbi:hypothetical protein YC2023_089419 [Brassica napus]
MILNPLPGGVSSPIKRMTAPILGSHVAVLTYSLSILKFPKALKRQMVHGTYGPLKLKECTCKAKHGQEKLLMCKKCFFTIGRCGSCRVCYTYASWFA